MKKRFLILGDGSVVRDHIYSADVVDAQVKVAFYPGKVRLLNFGSGQGKSLNDILAAIEVLLDRPVVYNYLAGRASDVSANVLGITHTQKYLVWSPQVSFDAGLAATSVGCFNSHD
jgi:UDP-glucose 4-epimerase